MVSEPKNQLGPVAAQVRTASKITGLETKPLETSGPGGTRVAWPVILSLIKVKGEERRLSSSSSDLMGP